MDNLVEVNGLSKRFRRFHPERPWTLQEAILGGLGRMKPVEYLWALRDVSFSVPSGSMLGVIGPNGAGKSTLLRLIGGVGRPDGGSVTVKGRVGALLELGAGFHPDLTGRENVFVTGVISGLTRREVSERFESIVDFAELEEFIDSPLRTYSNGMRMRLAFAVSIHTEADILLIDEVLAVGDISFQEKCLNRIAQFKAQGCAIIFVSHNERTIQEFCDEALWLQGGKVMAHGSSNMVVTQYIAQMTSETRLRTPAA
jgi:lipopolysaccharide transport system ATP-binding protein